MNPWVEGGIGTAALFLLYFFIKQLFGYLRERGQNDSTENNKIDRLCDKIDKMVEAFYASNQTNEVTKNQLGLQYDILLEIKDKVNEIDLRVQGKEVA